MFIDIIDEEIQYSIACRKYFIVKCKQNTQQHNHSPEMILTEDPFYQIQITQFQRVFISNRLCFSDYTILFLRLFILLRHLFLLFDPFNQGVPVLIIQMSSTSAALDASVSNETPFISSRRYIKPRRVLNDCIFATV